MSRVCELTGKKPMVGHTVSHSNIKTKRRYLPNLVNVTVHSDALGQSYSARVSAAALRTVDKRGGLDAFLAKAKDDQLSAKMLKVKKEIAKKAAAARSLIQPSGQAVSLQVLQEFYRVATHPKKLGYTHDEAVAFCDGDRKSVV